MPEMPTVRTVMRIFADSPDDSITIRQIYDHFLQGVQHEDHRGRIRHRIRSIIHSMCTQRRVRRTGRGVYISRTGFVRMHGGCVLTCPPVTPIDL